MKIIYLFFILPLTLFSQCLREDLKAQIKLSSVYKNISYRENDSLFNKFDLIVPQSEKRVPLVVYIHGGGFIRNDKRDVFNSPENQEVIYQLLTNKIAFASINYSLLSLKNETEGVKKSLKDARYALQFIRSKRDEYNINSKKIILWGNSAGASISLWLSVNDDMADDRATNEVKRNSTRALAAVLTETQATLDIKKWEDEVFTEFNINLTDLLRNYPQFLDKVFRLYGVNSIKELKSSNITEYRESVDSLAKISIDDPELWVRNIKADNGQPVKESGLSVHHPYHAKLIHRYYLEKELPIVAYYGEGNTPNESIFDFIIRKFAE